MLWHLRGFFLTCQFGFAVHVPHLSGNSICLWRTVCAYCGLAEVWSGIILLVDSDLVVGTIKRRWYFAIIWNAGCRQK